MKWTSSGYRGDQTYELPIGKFALLSLLGIVLIFAGMIGVGAGCRAYNRAQKRADARNTVQIVKTRIKQADQEAKVNRAQIAATKAEAEKRYQESIGIKRAQVEIAKTLTPLYVQHEAIQAQENIGRSGKNNTVIYVPGGNQGIPLVNDVSRQQPEPLSSTPPK